MAKIKTQWSCTECGHTQSKWAGQCPLCQAWNSLAEETQAKASEQRYTGRTGTSTRPVRLKEISTGTTPRIAVGMPEVDRLLGGGIVPGAFSLVGGAPGIGKSTLMLQLAETLAQQGLTVLYICGEESVEQTNLRAKRLGVTSDHLLLLSETNYNAITHAVEEVQPDVLIVDSIQILYKPELPSAPGSVSQVREVATEFMHLAKGKKITTFLIGHVTKSGELAGPRVLEHLVDTVLYFEGDRQHNHRLIRVVKNRFGPTDEVGVFQMDTTGLKEVPNPSLLFMEQRSGEVIGSAIVPTIEGSRPILTEAQALVTETVFSSPSRRCTGMDQNRLALLLAVLEKRVGYPMHRCDVFASVAGGLRVLEPAFDLGMLLAVASSFRNREIDPKTAVMGEIGLSGELRSIPRLDTRIKESVNMGFTRCLVPKVSVNGLSEEWSKTIHIQGVQNVEEAIDAAIR